VEGVIALDCFTVRLEVLSTNEKEKQHAEPVISNFQERIRAVAISATNGMITGAVFSSTTVFNLWQLTAKLSQS